MGPDTGTDVEGRVEPGGGTPSPEPLELPRRPRDRQRRRTPHAIIVILVAALGALTFIGLVTEPGGPAKRPIFEEDFESEEVGFSLDSDRTVDLTVVDGSYRVTIKDDRNPQAIRHGFARTYGALSFISTVALPAVDGNDAFAGVGCWNGDSAYLFVLMPDGSTGLLETISEETGERRELTELIRSGAAAPPGGANRLRIDCIGGGAGPTTVTGHLNGEPVVSVEVPNGYDAFWAIGFFLWTTEGNGFTIDDVSVSAGRPAVLERPFGLEAPEPERPPLTETGCDRVFADAQAAFEAGDGTDALDIVGLRAPLECATLADAVAASTRHSGRRSTRGLEEYLARSCAYVGPSARIRDTALCEEVLASHRELT